MQSNVKFVWPILLILTAVFADKETADASKEEFDGKTTEIAETS